MRRTTYRNPSTMTANYLGEHVSACPRPYAVVNSLRWQNIAIRLYIVSDFKARLSLLMIMFLPAIMFDIRCVLYHCVYLSCFATQSQSILYKCAFDYHSPSMHTMQYEVCLYQCGSKCHFFYCCLQSYHKILFEIVVYSY